ncbi:MAG: hypothetical protein QY306_11715 [Anaerolineales bacterium]|nr:MAG: hypothetical protein QY306_11715 [Anaerolineales bacterium]
MKINKDSFLKYIERINLKELGDPIEKRLGEHVVEYFPNYEIYWRNLVVPVTKRIEGYPNSIHLDVGMRQGINEQVENIISCSYTCFLHLIYAHMNYESQGMAYLENIYLHLGSAYDLAENFLEKNYLLLLDCTDIKSEILQSLTKEGFIKLAEEWYDKNYKDFHAYYLSKGKAREIRLPSGKNLLKEFIANQLGEDQLWKDYNGISTSIRKMRNAIVHDVRLGQIIVNGLLVMPRPSVIQNYRTWRSIRAVVDGKDNDAIRETLKRDFVTYPEQAKTDIDNTEVLINKLWGKMVDLMKNELYEKQNPKLLDYYQLVIE